MIKKAKYGIVMYCPDCLSIKDNCAWGTNSEFDFVWNSVEECWVCRCGCKFKEDKVIQCGKIQTKNSKANLSKNK